MKIQKPSLGRVVIFTASGGDEYAGTIVKVHTAGMAIVDLVTLGSSSIYHNNLVDHDASGKAGTWRYPPFVKEEIEVDG